MKKFLALLLLASMLLGMVSCSSAEEKKDPAKPDENKAQTEESVEENEEASKEEKEEDEEKKTEEAQNANLSVKLKLEKIGTLPSSDYSVSKCGVVLRNKDGKKAIATFDGKRKTEYKYVDAKAEMYAPFISVTNIESGKMDVNDLNTINSTGVVRGDTAKEILPMKYAIVEPLNERFILVLEGKKTTASKDEALFYLTSSYFTSVFSEPGESDICFTGTWQIFDADKERMIPGVSGTLPCNASARGDLLEYYNDERKRVYVDANGKEISSEEYSKSTHLVYTATEIEYHDDNGKKLFALDRTKYSNIVSEGDYFIVSKKGAGYEVFNKKGEKISTEFNEYISIYGNIVKSGDAVYNFDGEKLIVGKVTRVEMDPITEKYCVVELEANGYKSYALMDTDGNVVYSQDGRTADADYQVNDFVFVKKPGTYAYTYYSYASKDYKYSGSHVGNWMVSISVDGQSGKSLINVTNDEELLKGYASYRIQLNADKTTAYVFAVAADETVDVFKIK